MKVKVPSSKPPLPSPSQYFKLKLNKREKFCNVPWRFATKDSKFKSAGLLLLRKKPKPFPNVLFQGLPVQRHQLISMVDLVFVGRGSFCGTGRFKSQGDLETKAWIAPGNELKIGAACVPSALYGLCLKCGYVSRQLHTAISWSFWVVLRRRAEQTTWQRSSLEMRKAQTMATQSNRTRGWNLLTKQIGEGEINTRSSCCHWNIQKHLEIQEAFSSRATKGKASLRTDGEHHFCHLPQLFPATIIVLISCAVSSCLPKPGFRVSLRKPNVCKTWSPMK